MQILTKYKGASLANAPVVDALLNPREAVVLQREFFQTGAAGAFGFSSTGSPAISVSTTIATGAVVVASAGTPAAYAFASTAPVTQAAAARIISFEVMVSATSVTTANAAQFVGLSSSNTLCPITVAGVPNGTQSCIGFAFVEGAINGVFGSAAGGTIALATGNTAGTMRRLGFVVKGLSAIDFYVDGAMVATATTVPSTVMYESYSNASALQQGCTVDYMHLAYNR